MDGAPVFRSRRDAAAYISKKIGRTFTVGALHRHASDGTGPKYVMILGRASYADKWLDEWIEQLMRAPAPRRQATSRVGGECAGASAA